MHLSYSQRYSSDSILKNPPFLELGWLLFLLDKALNGLCDFIHSLNKGNVELHSLVQSSALFLNLLNGYTQISSKVQLLEAKSNTNPTRIVPGMVHCK